MATDISNDDEVIDTRDIIDRIAELEAQRDDEDVPQGERLTDEERDELQALTTLAESAEGYLPDWKYGETLVRDDYFTKYTKELLKECGYIPDDFPDWIEVDWEKTAENVQADYTELDFAGVTYWGR
jgi:hypothetical protein